MVRSTGVKLRPGYYVCTSGDRKRLHDVIWSYENKMEIPKGYVIHHIDWNKNHNEISNLIMLTVQEHNLIHNPPAVPTEEELKIIEKLCAKGLIK